MGELALIEQIRLEQIRAGAGKSRAAGRSLVLGIGDDCAILRPPRGHQLLVTTDFTLEGRHFRRDLHPPESVGHRTLARGLSDLAAMGARPLAAFLSLALPGELLSTRTGREWIDRFFSGLNALARLHGVPLAGGDTGESPSHHILADIVLLGSAPPGRALRRSGARAGDALYVTGSLGGAAAELAALEQRAAQGRKFSSARGNISPAAAAKLASGPTPHPQLYPQPRLAVGQALLRRRLATAAIDLSDGLSTDLAHLCRESHVGAEIEAAALPVHPLAAQTADPLAVALHGGEDYELLFAARPDARIPRSIATKTGAGVRITRIGTLTRGSGITLVDAAGRRTPLTPGGWEHFTRKA